MKKGKETLTDWLVVDTQATFLLSPDPVPLTPWSMLFWQKLVAGKHVLSSDLKLRLGPEIFWSGLLAFLTP